MNSVPNLGSRVLPRLAGDPQDRVVLQSTVGILLGLWFLLKTKFQVGTGMALGPLQDQGLRDVPMLPNPCRFLCLGSPSPKNRIRILPQGPEEGPKL